MSRTACIAERYSKKSRFTGTEVKSLLGITPAQWWHVLEVVHNYFVKNVIASRNIATEEQWGETPEQDCTLQGALIQVFVNSTLYNLAKYKSAEDRDKFSGVLKEKEHAAKSEKAKAAKKNETKGKATETKGKGKQCEMAPTRNSTKRSKQAQASLPDEEDKVYPEIDKFASSEDEAETPRDKADIGDDTDNENTSEEADKPFSVKTRKVERATYLTDWPIGISHCFPSRYLFERLGGAKLELRRKPWKMHNQLRIEWRVSGIKAEKIGTCWGKPTKRERSEIVEVSDDDDKDADEDADNDIDDDADDDNEGESEEEEEKGEEEEEAVEEGDAPRRKKTNTLRPKMPVKTHHLFDKPAESLPYESELEEEKGDLMSEYKGRVTGSQADSAAESERTAQEEMPSREPVGKGSYVNGSPDQGIPPGRCGDESIDIEVGYLTDASASSYNVGL
ncbi:uncharacterized protein H6S33_006974 [Morchella sextelata]|uniref:uncharacterized protein n=1 Tax=Morchella sextelata TaxID=1174677 RepID=UPI001D05B7CD|nr:uncharacterized protein H6S33_006974 [Morchella sextelata]KAH0603943.1 hypothetical protein H6S33_006974 [Morchella sextelata]